MKDDFANQSITVQSSVVITLITLPVQHCIHERGTCKANRLKMDKIITMGSISKAKEHISEDSLPC